MDELARVAAAVEGPWGLAGIALVGLYVLAWKFGGELMKLSRENNQATQNIQESIVTNHGSKNLGDAVDKLYDQLGVQELQFDELSQQVSDLLEQKNGSTRDTEKILARFDAVAGGVARNAREIRRHSVHIDSLTDRMDRHILLVTEENDD